MSVICTTHTTPSIVTTLTVIRKQRPTMDIVSAIYDRMHLFEREAAFYRIRQRLLYTPNDVLYIPHATCHETSDQTLPSKSPYLLIDYLSPNDWHSASLKHESLLSDPTLIHTILISIGRFHYDIIFQQFYPVTESKWYK